MIILIETTIVEAGRSYYWNERRVQCNSEYPHKVDAIKSDNQEPSYKKQSAATDFAFETIIQFK